MMNQLMLQSREIQELQSELSNARKALSSTRLVDAFNDEKLVANSRGSGILDFGNLTENGDCDHDEDEDAEDDGLALALVKLGSSSSGISPCGRRSRSRSSGSDSDYRCDIEPYSGSDSDTDEAESHSGSGGGSSSIKTALCGYQEGKYNCDPKMMAVITAVRSQVRRTV